MAGRTQLVWNTSFTGAGDFILRAAVNHAKYVGFEEAQVRHARGQADAAVSDHVNELEALYAAEQKNTKENALWQQFKLQQDDMFAEFMRDHVLLKVTADTEVAPAPLPGQEVQAKLALCARKDRRQAFRFASLTDLSLESQLELNTLSDANEPVPHIDGDASMTIVSVPSSLRLHLETEQGQPPSLVPLSDLLGKSPSIAKVELSRRMIEKATVAVKVHTTNAGARKRKAMDDLDDDPFGGPAKPWQFDAQDRSHQEHVMELRSIVMAFAAGLCAEGARAASRIVVASDAAPPTELIRQGGSQVWKSIQSAQRHSLEYDRTIGMWQYDNGNGVVYTSQVNETLWSPLQSLPLSGAKFLDHGTGNCVLLFVHPPKLLWYNKVCYEFAGTGAVAGTSVLAPEWQGKATAVLRAQWPPPASVAGDETTALLSFVANPTSTPVAVDINDVTYGHALSSRMYTNLADERATHHAFGKRALLSAYPFQENVKDACPSALERVWEGFINELDITSADDFMENRCYVLKQSARDGRTSTPVIQLSNSFNKWAVGTAATPAGDALLATMLYMMINIL